MFLVRRPKCLLNVVIGYPRRIGVSPNKKFAKGETYWITSQMVSYNTLFVLHWTPPTLPTWLTSEGWRVKNRYFAIILQIIHFRKPTQKYGFKVQNISNKSIYSTINLHEDLRKQYGFCIYLYLICYVIIYVIYLKSTGCM